MKIKHYTVCIILILCTSYYLSGQLYINEVIPTNNAVLADNYGEYDDIIEIYNAGGSAVNLAGYYLSDDTGDPTQWQIPATNSALTTVPAGGYLIFWADNETIQGENHLNFKLSSSGENIVLTKPDGVTTEDSFTFPAVATDQAYGRLPDGSATLSQLVPPSPAATNDNSQPKVEPPVIDLATGVYTGSRTVGITAEVGASIYYTTDGTTPTTSSPPYSGAFTVNTSQSLRAIAVRVGYTDSDVALASYIFNPDTELPVIHLTIDPNYLWDDAIGMYVSGTNGIEGPCTVGTLHNFNQSWEYPANVTLYEKDGSLAFSENCGVSIAGGCSRRHPKKSFNVGFKSQYGVGKLDYQLFDHKPQDEFQGFKIRSGANARHKERIMDAFTQATFEGELDIDHQSDRPVAFYINGEYWGLYSIRDRMFDGYIDTYYPKLNKDSLDLIELPKATGTYQPWMFEEVKDGDNIAYHALYDFFTTNSLASTANYDYISSQIDINSVLDYMAVNIFVNNTDWPHNNLKVWRDRTDPDAKWRWMMFDLEKLYHSGGSTSLNMLDWIMNQNDPTLRQNPVSCAPFRQLMANAEFEAEFIQRSNTYIGTIWEASRVQGIFQEMKNEISTEIQADYQRWVPEQSDTWDYDRWNTDVDEMYDFFVDRPPYMREMIDVVLGKSGRHTLTFNVNSNSGGKVAMHSSYFELPYNYSGTYHNNVPYQIHAIPDPGYRFVEWLETGETNTTITKTYSSDQTLTPVFEAALDVVINEIHYHPNDSVNEKEFIEIYNPDTKAWDLSDYEFSEGICFKFPKGTSIAAGEYIVIAADATQYAGNGYQVFQWEESKLSNDGEKLYLDNLINDHVDTVRYNDGIPWPLLADGFGASLELNYPIPADNFAGSNWHASALDSGTPGAQNSMPCTAAIQEIVINEINYNSNNFTNPGDWIELYNPNSASIDISNWQFYDSENTFIIPNGTSLAADGFLVLAEDVTQFGSIFPHLNNGTDYIGDLAFNISNGGERVSLFDQNKCLVDELTFNDKIPWDTIPDGNGPTLSLIAPNSDNTLPQSWESSSNINSAYGTPGRENTPCLVGKIAVPLVVCPNVATTIRYDAPQPGITYQWNVFGATVSASNTDSFTAIWSNPGTYNVQLIMSYFDCTKVLFYQVEVGCTPDHIFTTNEDTPTTDNLSSGMTTTILTDVANGTLNLQANGAFDYMPDPDYFGTDIFIYQYCIGAPPDTIYNAYTANFWGEIEDANDDAEEKTTNGVMTLNSPDLDMVIDASSTAYTGLRWQNVTIPANANITNAYIAFKAKGSTADPTSLYIRGEATGNSVAFSANTYDLSNRNTTTNTSDWLNIPAWTSDGIYNSPDISAIVQEIVDRNDWASGNAMSFFVDGSGLRIATTLESGYATQLYVDYEVVLQDTIVGGIVCDTLLAMINVMPENDAPIATDDSITTDEDTPKTGNLIANDTDADGDNLSMNITPIVSPQNGSFSLSASGSYSYTPNADFNGTDTFEYEICDDGSPIMCDTASVAIDVVPVNDAPIPLPDTLYMFANSSIQDNILLNDSDIENHNLTATIIPMVVPSNGNVTVQPNGNINHTPSPNFVGTDSFTYEVCDDGTPSMCNTSTVVIIIEPDCIDIELAAWLEGAFNPTLGEMRTTLVSTRKLLPGQTPTSNLATPTPAGQPYSIAPWNYAGTEGAGWTDADYTGDETDWVLVSFRTGTAKSTEVGMTAALLMKDGSITFPNRCALTSTVASPIYIVVEHRNHIGVMTPQPVSIVNSTLTYDFRLSDSYRDPTSFGQKQTSTGEWAMYAGDADQSDFPSFDIQGTDKTIWFDNNGVFDYYFAPDFNLDGDINGQDKSLWFDNNGISSRVPK